jgi:hypothetical protein
MVPQLRRHGRPQEGVESGGQLTAGRSTTGRVRAVNAGASAASGGRDRGQGVPRVSARALVGFAEAHSNEPLDDSLGQGPVDRKVQRALGHRVAR